MKEICNSLLIQVQKHANNLYSLRLYIDSKKSKKIIIVGVRVAVTSREGERMGL